jgi:uncharacterized membrane protein required for colicin V production
MTLADFQAGWFDLVALTMLVVGVIRGRKRGMSEELLDFLQWLLIVVAGGGLYRPLTQVLALPAGTFGPALLAVIVYLLIALFIKLVFSMIKRSVGQKLVEGDMFGNLEYYLGMGAGAVRYACMLVFAMALLNAKHFTSAELAASAKRQKDNFGSISFPTLGSTQQTVFQKSYVGRLAKAHLASLLIETAPAKHQVARDNVFRRHERAVDEVLRGN